ncbi:MAG: ATP-binding protein [Prolixibacteraceae bacterium]
MVLVVLLIQSLICLSSNQERYLHFTEVDGLPRNITTCLAQDQYGYIWIGTNNGVARYDGKDFYGYDELSGIGVTHLLYDSKNTLWACSERGLYKYNRITNFFDPIIEGYISKIEEDHGKIYFLMMSNIFRLDGNEMVNVFQGNEISDFCFSKEGLWVSTSNNGVSLFNRKTAFKDVVATYLEGKAVSVISKVDNELFIGLFNGQLYAIPDQGQILKIDLDNHYFFKRVIKVGREIWLATDGNGIIILDTDLRFLRILDKNMNTSASINSNSIYDILPGKNQEIWLASFGAGLTCILPDNQLFQNILPEKGNKNSLVANEAVSVKVKEPYIYFGTNYGLSEWNKNSGHFVNLPSSSLRKDLNGTKVTAINIDQENNIWVGTYDGLLGKYSSGYQLLKTFHPCGSDPDEIQQIVDLIEVDKSHLLLLTQYHTRILINFDIEKETTSVFEMYSKGSNNTYCLLNSLRKNHQGELLAVISNLGLFHVNWTDNVLENRMSEMNAKIDCYITDFYQDMKGDYWLASSTDGLLKVSQDGKLFKKWSVKEGLPSNTLMRIESSDDRFLWISTISGICRFDTKTEEVLNFNHRDGLPANEFKERVSDVVSDGRIIFGSLAGFTIIDPTKVNPDTSKTEVVISDITFQNQSIRSPKGEQFLSDALEETKEITLPYNKNSFSIHFFTKNKSFSKYHNYEYRLIGLEENWTYQGETNFTTYTNLSSGSYTFEIKGADKTLTDITTRLIINIKAPWYLSRYAYIIYIILFFTILYLSIYAVLKKFELVKEKEISEYKIQKEHELTEKKLAFFTSISHDLKTPLTLIDAPVNDLLNNENLSPEQTNKLQIIKRNSKRLYQLITDLLDFRKITQNQYKLEVKETSVSEIIKNAYEAFKEECAKKSVDLNLDLVDRVDGFIDASKMEKILWNLLSNAIKFTNKGGAISIGLEVVKLGESRNIHLIVGDNGIGIPATETSKIFDRFYKVQDSTKANQEGTGIGLSIVKELVEIHHGTIQVNSEPGSGTTFMVTIPIDIAAYTESEMAVNDQNSETSELEETQNHQHNATKKRYNLQVILVVEDHSELRDFLAEHFEKSFKVYSASDGFEGLKLAKEINPDVILTDVQMPNMNGYEFCKEIRLNFDTSHIPVLMLTANATIEQHLEGLSTGADSYLTKPFDIRLLDAQINALLENRKKLRNKFHGIDTTENLAKALPQKDIDFILELKSFIELNIMNTELNVELLSEHFTVSIAQLHRKIKALTDSTPNTLIKSIRLKKAYKLIKEEGFRVSEAAYQTGFSDPNYFTTCFKKEFGENPSKV